MFQEEIMLQATTTVSEEVCCAHMKTHAFKLVLKGLPDSNFILPAQRPT